MLLVRGHTSFRVGGRRRRPHLFTYVLSQRPSAKKHHEDRRIAATVDSERAGVARRQMDQGLNLEKILTYVIEGCLSASKTFGKYYRLVDLTGSCDMSET